MGYDLHIIRRAHWSDTGDDISAEEWLALVAADPELHLEVSNGPYFASWHRPSLDGNHWLEWSNGQISTKNPANVLIDKMVDISQKLGARVQGDDGEIYQDSAHHPRVVRISAFKLFLYKMQNLSSRFFAQPKLPPPPFKVGDRVICSSRGLATVKSINRRANHGYGELRVLSDDGKEWTHMLFAHGYSKIEGEETPGHP
ncbi:MAG: hypothetical protein WBV22_13265 [Anaerolineaceae bacterium]